MAQNGQTIARGSALNGIPAIPLSPRPSTVRFTLTASRHSRYLPLSPASRTVWTWRSARDTTARVPQAWYCSYTQLRYSVRYHRDCAVQPLMTLSYRVRGMSLTGQTRPGPQVMDVTAGHIQLGGTARVTGAQAQVSFNSGRTWSPATVTALGGGRFRAAYTAPPAPRDPADQRHRRRGRLHPRDHHPRLRSVQVNRPAPTEQIPGASHMSKKIRLTVVTGRGRPTACWPHSAAGWACAGC